MQWKHLTCSKRASYLGNTSWPDSPKLMKVLVKIGLNRLSNLHIPSWHITFFTVSYFLSDILRIPADDRKRNLQIFTLFFFFFSRNSQRYHQWIVESIEKIFKEFCKRLPIMVRQRSKFYFLEPLNHLFHHSVNKYFWKK